MIEPTTLQDNFAQYLAGECASVGVTPPEVEGGDVQMRCYKERGSLFLLKTYVVNSAGKVEVVL